MNSALSICVLFAFSFFIELEFVSIFVIDSMFVVNEIRGCIEALWRINFLRLDLLLDQRGSYGNFVFLLDLIGSKLSLQLVKLAGIGHLYSIAW